MDSNVEWYSTPDRGFERITKDKVDPNVSGFHWKSHGRSANIYFVESQSVTIIYAEMPAVKDLDILVFGETEHIKKRYYPFEGRVDDVPLEERFRIQKLLVEWLESKGMRHDISLGR